LRIALTGKAKKGSASAVTDSSAPLFHEHNQAQLQIVPGSASSDFATCLSGARWRFSSCSTATAKHVTISQWSPRLIDNGYSQWEITALIKVPSLHSEWDHSSGKEEGNDQHLTAKMTSRRRSNRGKQPSDPGKDGARCRSRPPHHISQRGDRRREPTGPSVRKWWSFRVGGDGLRQIDATSQNNIHDCSRVRVMRDTRSATAFCRSSRSHDSDGQGLL